MVGWAGAVGLHSPGLGRAPSFGLPLSGRNIRDVLEKLAVTAVRKSRGKEIQAIGNWDLLTMQFICDYFLMIIYGSICTHFNLFCECTLNFKI